jgi:Holliday junction resolvase RusA-like endonuclease
MTNTTAKPPDILIEIPGLPKMYNQFKNMHWAAKAKHVKQWKQLVFISLVSKKLIPASPYSKARLKLVRCSSAPPDFDNIAQSFKPVLDGLVEAGVLQDDSLAVIGKPEYGWEKVAPSQGKIIIQVWRDE